MRSHARKWPEWLMERLYYPYCVRCGMVTVFACYDSTGVTYHETLSAGRGFGV